MSDDTSEFTNGPVPDERTVAWPRVAAISAMVAFSLPTFITGLEVAGSTTPERTFLALGIGSIILTVIATLMGIIGAKTRLNSYLLVRLAFGDRGAALVNIAFALSLLGWFGVNIDLFSAAVAELSQAVLGQSVPRIPVEIGAGLLMTLTTVYGFKAINSLSVLLVPVMALITALFLMSAVGVELSTNRLLGDGEPVPLGYAISATVGGVIIGAIILPDITRFCRSWQGALITALLAYLIIELIVMGSAAMAGLASGEADILQLLVGTGFGLGAFIIVIAGSWVLNSLNLYSTVLSVEASWRKLSSRTLTLILGAVGIFAAFFNILDAFLTFLIYLAVVFVPVAGVIIVDVFLAAPSRYRDPDFETRIATNRAGLGAWILGAGYAAADLNFTIPSLSGAVVVDAVIATGLAYLLLSRIWPRRDQEDRI